MIFFLLAQIVYTPVHSKHISFHIRHLFTEIALPCNTSSPRVRYSILTVLYYLHDPVHLPEVKTHMVSTDLPVYNEEGEVQLQPLVVWDKRMKKKGNRAITEVLIQWRHTNLKDAVWKELYVVQQQFPNFDWNSNRP